MLGAAPVIGDSTSSSPLAGEVRWGVNTNTEESRPLTPNPSPKGRGEEIVINPSADLGRHTVSHGSYLAGSNLYPVGRGKVATLKPDATSEQGVMTGAAVQLEDVDLSEVPLDKPLLDYLHENNVQIPQSEYDDEGNLVQSGSILAPESAYTLTEVPAGEDGAAPTGDNIITKYELKPVTRYYDPVTGVEVAEADRLPDIQYKEVVFNEALPVYYQVSLKQTEYGDPQGDVTLTFGWQKDEDGDTEFVQDPTNPIGQTITYKYKSSETATPGSGSYAAEYINKVQPITLNNPDGTSSSHYQATGGVQNVTNFENVLFKDNNTDVTLNVYGDGTSYKYSYVDVRGGALNNSTDIDILSGAFINNSITSTTNEVNDSDFGRVHAYGGALHNSGKITNLNVDFSNNSSNGNAFIVYGGALYNSGEISNITGNFINNNSTSNRDNWLGKTSGGAIYNSNKIGNITGNFIGNYTKASRGNSAGGAIYNTGEIGDIHGSFIGNYSSSDEYASGGSTATGGAINNEGGKIGNIIGDFINNSADGTNARGAAIYNYRGTIGNITGDFINNSVDGTWYYEGPQGSAIYNDMGTIGDITGDFINNNSSAIYITNSGKINNITGDFIGNETGIDNTWGYINNITGNFIGNENRAISNSRIINTITGDFIGNFAANGYGVAISNTGTIGDITGDFFGNYANYDGGAIYNSGTIGDITGDFIGNSGAIYNYEGTIGNITGNFIGNSADYYGGAIYNYYGTIKNITGNFIGNTGNEGVLWNDGTIETIKGDFINNSSTGNGGAIHNTYYSAYQGGATYIPQFETSGIIEHIINSSFYGNSVQAKYPSEVIGQGKAGKGGAIYTNRDLTITAQDSGQSVFSGNYVQDIDGQKDYQAIYVEIPNEEIYYNTTRPLEVKGAPTTLTLAAQTNGTILINDKISGSTNFVGGYKNHNGDWVDENGTLTDAPEKITYTLNITGDETGKVILNNTVDANEYEYNYTYNSYEVGNIIGKAPVNISLEKTNLYLGARDDVLNSNNLDLKSGSMSMVNDAAGVSALNSFTVSGDTNFVADVDLANKEMDRFTASEYGSHTGNLNVVGMNLLSDAPEGQEVTAVYFAEPGLKNNVVNAVGELPGAYQTAYTPIYKYNVTYDNENQYDGKGDGGYFLFTRGDKIPVLPDPEPEPDEEPDEPTPTPDPGTEPDEPDVPVIPTPPQGGGGSTGNPSDAFNPAVLATPVGNLAAGQAAMNEAFKYVFEHADAFTQLPSMERYAKINANKYALSTDFNENLPSYADQLHNNAVWFRPYTTFETMNIKNGPKVDAITYGSLVGFDGDFKEMKNGWHRVFTGYAGYMGSSLNYSGVDTSMNGGLLGFTETFYKGNFWTAITASAGASVGESHTMYGKEDYTSLLAGVGSKTGYNFEFKDGKFIIQPIMYLSYTFVNTFDYKNAAGVNIESDPLHTIQLNPSVRFIANLKGGWQPYASVGMVWNLMNESKVTANNVKLPEMSVKPYVEYGVGVQRNWADKFTAFLQAMIRNGGRNGIALTGGFRFMLGSDNDNPDKPKVKKEIKSL